VGEQHYSNIIKEHADTVYRVALSYTDSVQDAEDAVQNVFLKLLAKKPEFTDEEHARRWLIRVTVNECKNIWNCFWRKRVNMVETLPEKAEPETETHSKVYEEVMALPPKYRIVIYLYYYEEYSVKEIAGILHMKEATVRTHLARGRKQLKLQMDNQEMGDSDNSGCVGQIFPG